VSQEDRAVRAEPDERLLADRHETPEPGERVPHHREDDEDVERGQLLHRVCTEHERHECEQPDQHDETARERQRDRVPAADAQAATLRSVPAASTARATSTARKTTCPASAKYSGSICAPIVCAAPST